MHLSRLCAGLAFIAGFNPVQSLKPRAPYKLPDLYEASVLELQEGLDGGHFTSVDLVKVGPIEIQSFMDSE